MGGIYSQGERPLWENLIGVGGLDRPQEKPKKSLVMSKQKKGEQKGDDAGKGRRDGFPLKRPLPGLGETNPSWDETPPPLSLKRD